MEIEKQSLAGVFLESPASGSLGLEETDGRRNKGCAEGVRDHREATLRNAMPFSTLIQSFISHGNTHSCIWGYEELEHVLPYYFILPLLEFSTNRDSEKEAAAKYCGREPGWGCD